ncbi:PSD1 and planctomycete cytochrome C domain-containing protein [Verrucomicrobia bacterium]|nr:PSD1 and planctomycete cytochrome C domain-containing protein [Verrucomicrobiota bacterium]
MARWIYLGALVAFQLAAAPPVSEKHSAEMARGLTLFKSDVRAVLKQHCVKCHGGDKTRGGLDFTTRASLLKGGDEGVVIVPGKAKASLLFRLISHLEKPHMPVKNPKLPDDAIQKIEKWIDLGAPYDQPLIVKTGSPKGMQVTDDDRKFWSFVPLKKPKAPTVKNKKWTNNEIDQFVLRKLEGAKLTPNGPAESRVLIRRLYFDLIGLPPTPKEVDAFVKASLVNRQSALENLVDQLLASKHYGERWGRHWLDVARFAESHGFEQDYDRKFAFHYRDFVIKALNADMPYDQFVKWQVAGDEFAPDNPLAMMATGFLGAGVFPTQLTEKEFESARYDELDDMANTTGTAMLGLTIGCARCHDHKFDPIPTRDYYRFINTFATTIRSEIDLEINSAATVSAKAKWEKEHAPLVAALAKFEQVELPKRFAAWAKNPPANTTQKMSWMVLDHMQVKSLDGATFAKQDDGSFILGGKNPVNDRWVLTAELQAMGLNAIRIEALVDKSMKRNGPGRASNGNFALSDIRVFATPKKGGKRQSVKLINPKATHQQNTGGLSVASSIDGDKRKSGWAVDVGGIGKDQAAVFEFAAPVGFEGGTVLTIEMDFFVNTSHTIGRPRVAVTAAPKPVAIKGDGRAASLATLMESLKKGGGPDKLNAKERAELTKIYRAQDTEWTKLNNKVQQHMSAKPQTKKEKVQVTSEGFKPTKHHADGRGFPHFYKQTYFLKRGDPNQKHGEATQGFLQVLMRGSKNEEAWQVSAPKDWRTSYRRRSLANWMTDTQNGAGHLLARVMANRLWQHHMGRGIVNTPNDFGLQGELPTHPQLLDWLASELIEGGWRLKPLHKKIVMSATYLQSSGYNVAKMKTDPLNKLHWRRTPTRLQAEVIRDSLLEMSGLLDTRMYGAGTLDERMKRRSIYFMIKRSRLIPTMQLFDSPEPLVSQGSRPSTIIAPQALHFMNNAQVREAAVALAGQFEKKTEDGDAISLAYQTVVGREPTISEKKSITAFMNVQAESYQAGGRKDARKLALADLAQVLFGLNEFIYVN